MLRSRRACIDSCVLTLTLICSMSLRLSPPFRPRRLIIPGYIGGRMIKWLQEICVTAEESQNYYHFHDNRVLPSHVDEALANAEGERARGAADGVL